MNPSFVTPLKSRGDLGQKEFTEKTSEVLISVRELSRFGYFSSKEAQELAEKAKSKGLKVTLEWDVLMTEERFHICLLILKKMDLNLFDHIRVQDPGALEYTIKLCDDYTHLKIQLNLETGNHNLLGIKKWVSYVGEKLERIIISIELPKEKMIEIQKSLENVKIEVLGLGRILLFYTPRSLLKPHAPDPFGDGQDDYLEALGSSQESPHRGFPIIENQHGTFMFHLKDHCLLEDLSQLCSHGIHNFRIDDRFYDIDRKKLWSLLGHLDSKQKVLSSIKDIWPSALIQGFYRANKSDVLFKKLKNHRLQKRDQTYLGEVLEVVKGHHMAVSIKNRQRPLKLEDRLFILTPDGKRKELEVKKMWKVSGQKIERASADEIVLLAPLDSVSIRSMVFFEEQ